MNYQTKGRKLSQRPNSVPDPSLLGPGTTAVPQVSCTHQTCPHLSTSQLPYSLTPSALRFRVMDDSTASPASHSGFQTPWPVTWGTGHTPRRQVDTQRPRFTMGLGKGKW